MTRKLIATFALTAFCLAFCCGAYASDASSVSLRASSSTAGVAAKPEKKNQTVVFKTHLHCENCVKKVVENISYVKGVVDLEVSLAEQTIKVTYNPAKTDVETLAGEIRKLGYKAEIQ